MEDFRFTEEHWQKIDKMREDIINIKQLLKGYDGTTGLVDQVNCNTKAINQIWLIFAFIGGGGGLTVGIIEVVKAFSG